MTLLVRLRAEAGRDALGDVTYSLGEPVAVPGCLWAPGTPQDLAADRPDGVEVTATAHFPRSWSGELRGALVSLDGDEWMRVVGDPRRYPVRAGRWGTYVLLRRSDG